MPVVAVVVDSSLVMVQVMVVKVVEEEVKLKKVILVLVALVVDNLVNQVNQMIQMDLPTQEQTVEMVDFPLVVEGVQAHFYLVTPAIQSIITDKVVLVL
tara:strand:+ start:544 stop:840 length:297 start_codon:yes stop_codon:yes gene_type:complete